MIEFKFANLFGYNKNVYIIGDFTNWTRKPIENGELLQINIYKPGLYKFYYIVNGVSTYCNKKLCIINEHGYCVNYLLVDEFYLNNDYIEQSILFNDPDICYYIIDYAHRYNSYKNYSDWSIKMLIRAAKLSHTIAMQQLAKYYIHTNNRKLAKYYLKTAYNLGDMVAAAEFGNYYVHYYSDYDSALKYWNISAKSGCVYGKIELQRYYNDFGYQNDFAYL